MGWNDGATTGASIAAVDRSFLLPRQSRRYHELRQRNHPCRQGPFDREERLLFLKGLRRYGTGRWKEIGLYVTSRSNQQIKSHAQKALHKASRGSGPHFSTRRGVFDELDVAEAQGTAPPSPAVPHHRLVWDGRNGAPLEQAGAPTSLLLFRPPVIDLFDDEPLSERPASAACSTQEGRATSTTPTTLERSSLYQVQLLDEESIRGAQALCGLQQEPCRELVSMPPDGGDELVRE